MSAFHVATGSVVGREHRRLLRNNQDGVAACVAGEVGVVVVTDGCGSGASSEVGARLGARLLATMLPGLVREVGVGPQLAERATEELLAWLYKVVRPSVGDELASWVEDQWLFTFLCAVMDPKHALIFGVGDGVWSADDAVKVLDPGSENAPDYLAYRLVPTAMMDTRPSRRFGVHKVHFCGEARQVAVATDGLAADAALLQKFSADPVVWRNPAALQRKLNVLSARDKVLHDDATVALMKRSG
jgi:hypothetical protein